MSEFLFDLEDPDADEPLTLDAENVFIYVVKKPNEYDYLTSLVQLGEKPDLEYYDPAMATLELSLVEDVDYFDIYYNQFWNRVLQAKANAWAQEYMRNFPDEMTVYYEDDDITVYRLKQNPYELNNFRIARGGA
jgi:F0F1-type ATP synthase gamma subunit